LANKEQIIINPLYDVSTTLANNPIYIKSYSVDTSDYSGASDTKIQWDGSFFSNKITHSATTDNTKFTIEETGKYFLATSFTWQGDNNNIREIMEGNIFVNGVKETDRSFSYQRDSGATINKATVLLNSTLDLISGDYIEIGITAGAVSGTAIPIANAFSFNLHKLGGENVNESNVITLQSVAEIDNTDSPYISSWGQDIEVDCTSGAVTIELPPSASSSGKAINITKVDSSANAITINSYGSETINGSASDTISFQWTSIRYKTNGTNVTKR
jgi:hypothetical protein